MNKNLFWFGLGFQLIQMLALGVIGLSIIDWSFITPELVAIVVFVTLNITSIISMIVGALSKK